MIPLKITLKGSFEDTEENAEKLAKFLHNLEEQRKHWYFKELNLQIVWHKTLDEL